MSRLSKSHFWEWFKRHNKEYLDLKTKTKKEAGYWLNELKTHLRAYSRCFGFSLAWGNNEPATLTITVDGKAIHFKKADSFVAAAPEITGWVVSALEEPLPIDFMLEKEIENAGVHPEELSFSFASDDPDDKAITVYHPLCTEENRHHFLQLANAAVYNLLGERSYGMDISYVEVANLSYAGSNKVRKLEELPACIGLRKSAMVVDDEGRLMGGC